jgi:hypothetical protein
MSEQVAVQTMAKPTITSVASGLLQRCTATTECDDCRRKREAIMQRAAVNSSPANEVPPIVHEVLHSQGQPLDATTRAFMEPRFGHDFSNVRVHTDAKAAESAQKVNAHAYSVQHNIVFDTGRFAPETSKGRWLLAHELAHVVQQSGSRVMLQKLGANESALETQADAAANAVLQDRHVSVLDRVSSQVQQFPRCRALWDPATPSVASVAENDVRNEIVRQRSGFGPLEIEFPIPGGSARPGRTEPRRGRQDVITPQTIDPSITGFADIAQLNGTSLELIELKRADLPELVFAEEQVLRYVFQGGRAMGEVNRFWRGRRHAETLTSLRAMPVNRFTPISPQRIGGTPVSISWCRDGVMTYKAIGDRDPEIFLCGVTDRGRIDAFLDRILDRAQARVDEFIRDEVEERATQMANHSLRDAVRYILNRPEVRQYVPPGLSDDAIVDLIVRELQPFESFIRAKVHELIQNAIAQLRRMLQAEIRNLLEISFNALCLTAAQMTARELLNEFERRMRDRAIQLIPVAVAIAARSMLRALIEDLAAVMLRALAYVAAAVVVVLVAIVLWEVAAAIVAAGAIEAALMALAEFVTLVFSRLAF